MIEGLATDAIDPQTIVEPARSILPGWCADFAADFARYREHRIGASIATILATEQGLWALLVYRAARGLHLSNLPGPIKGACLAVAAICEKLVEIVTGIALPHRAAIGPGLYIGHFGNIILHEDVVLGQRCNISQGVTIGVSGRGASKGTPRIGDRVYVATNAVVVGPIYVGDDAMVAANSLVTRNVAPRTTVMGVPAKKVRDVGSDGYL